MQYPIILCCSSPELPGHTVASAGMCAYIFAGTELQEISFLFWIIIETVTRNSAFYPLKKQKRIKQNATSLHDELSKLLLTINCASHPGYCLKLASFLKIFTAKLSSFW